MVDEVRVDVVLDKSKAERSLRDLAQQLSLTDRLLDQMQRTGVTWHSNLKDATKELQKNLEVIGEVTTAASDKSIKGNKAFAKSLDTIKTKIKDVSSSIIEMTKNYQGFANATKTPATAPLRRDDEKRRQNYFAEIQKQYQKEQAALKAHHDKMEAIRKQRLSTEQTQLQNRIAAQNQFTKLQIEAQKRSESAVKCFCEKLAKSTAVKESMDRLKSIKQLFIDLQKTSASGLIATKPLRDIAGLNASLNKQHTMLGQGIQKLREKAQIETEAERASRRLADGTNRVTAATIKQAGAANRLSQSWRLAKQEIRDSVSVVNLFQAAARGASAAIFGLTSKFAEMVKTAPDLASEMLGFRNALALVTGNQKEASGLLLNAIGIAEELKLSITAVTKEYSKFVNSATIAGLSIQKSTETFKNYAIAARVLNLSQQRTSGMFLALEQMISKGRVSMEELRRQLGEHIPGALNLAAQAMGYGRDELGKFIKEVSSGNVVSLELVENLGKLVKERTIAQLPTSLLKFSAASQDLANAFTMLQLKLGDLMSRFLVPLYTMLAGLVRSFTNLLPATEVLGESTENLSAAYEAVDTTASAVATTFENVNSLATNIDQVFDGNAESLNNLKMEMEGVSIAGMAMLGTVGTAGLGGAFAALGKAVNLVKAGLRNFAAPFITLGTKLKPILAALGGAGLLGIIKKLRLGIASLAVYLKSVAAGFTLLALANPWVLITAGIAAATAGIYAYLDANEEAKQINNQFKKTFDEAQKKVTDFNTRLQEVIETASKFDQIEISVKAADLQAMGNRLQRHNEYMEDGRKLLESQRTWWDKLAAGAGHVTNNARRINDEQHQLLVAIQINNRELDTMEDKTKEVEQATNDVVEAFKKVQEISQQFLAEADLKKLELDISLVGADALTAQLSRIQLEASIAIAKINAEMAGTPEATAQIEVINRKRDLQVELAKLQSGYRAAQTAQREFETSSNSLATSIGNAITQLKQQEATIGKSGIALDRLNNQFKIAALNEQILEVSTKATTTTQKKQVAAMQAQLELMQNLQERVIALKDQEALRQAKLRMQDEATRKRLDLMKEGHALLENTLTLEQKFALRVDDVNKALDAVGATSAQRSEVLKQEWRKIVDNADNGLKSMEALSEEFAKGMQENFSNFFFDVMNGEFDNLADSFVAMLQRMVAEAIATNLTKYIMGPGGGGGLFDSFFGSSFSQALFNTPGPVPNTSAGILQMGSGFVNLPGNAYGGDYTVGGTGGTDSQIVAFRATPGEHIKVTPPSKKSFVGNTSEETYQPIINFNVTTPDYGSFYASMPQLELQLRRMVQHGGRNA